MGAAGLFAGCAHFIVSGETPQIRGDSRDEGSEAGRVGASARKIGATARFGSPIEGRRLSFASPTTNCAMTIEPCL